MDTFNFLCIGSAGSGCWLVAGARIIESDLTVLLNFLELTLLNFFVDRVRVSSTGGQSCPDCAALAVAGAAPPSAAQRAPGANFSETMRLIFNTLTN